MSENAPPPIGHHSDWLPFIAAVELALRQLGDPVQAMDAAISAVDSWVADVISARESWVPALIVVRGVRRLVTSTDKFKIHYFTYRDDDEQERLEREWRNETTVELITIEQDREHREQVPLFFWRPKWEEFLGLRPAAAHEAKEPSGPVAPGPQPEPEQRTWTSKELIGAAFDRLREKHQNKYSEGFAGAKPSVLRNQARPIWDEICKAHSVSSEDHPLPNWDSFKRERDRRVALERERDRRCE